jgi:pimeloyl-ACP methyl ester carboxylesterase
MRLAHLLAMLAWVTLAQAQPDYAREGNKAPDYAREKRWAEEITPGLVVGDALYIVQKSGHKFLAIYTESKPARAAVIIVHGLGVHPDWALIGALRSGLADQGYATLAVQMPVLAVDALREDYPPLFPEAADRLRAAVAFLKAKGHRNIAIACHSLGARMCNYFQVSAPDPGAAAWISISIVPSDFMEPAKLHLPILDVYGERDFAPVREAAGARAAVLRTLKGSAQVEVAGADHYFNGSEQALTSQIRRFLDRKFD